MSTFPWPNNKRAALSLTFDDTRITQADVGLSILDDYNAKATFYVSLHLMEHRLDAWRSAAKNGHEMANHTVSHPCSGNHAFSRSNALEEYSLERMEQELDDANARIEELVGVKARSFAYPCGSKFVGRGEQLQSYVPLVARRFLTGRGFRDEAANDPMFCDFAQLFGVDSDCRDVNSLMVDIEAALSNGSWLIFCSHNVAEGGRQTFHQDALAEVCRFAQNEKNGIWLDTVESVAEHVKKVRE